MGARAPDAGSKPLDQVVLVDDPAGDVNDDVDQLAVTRGESLAAVPNLDLPAILIAHSSHGGVGPASNFEADVDQLQVQALNDAVSHFFSS